MRLPVRILAALIWAVLAARPANATPELNAGNELWIFPGQSGWGLNLFHQGDTLFASLFVYGPDNQPQWYTASDLRNIGNAVYTGGLYESTGPWFGGSFYPGAVTRRQVGSMRVELGHGMATVTYDVDRLTLKRTLVPFTFERTDLSGTYAGFVTQPTTPEINEERSITIDHSASSLTMVTQGSSSGSCTYTGTYSPNGQLADVFGTFSCSPNDQGTFNMLDLDVTRSGFTGRLNTGPPNRSPVSTARVGGVRSQGSGPQGVGSLSDLWWNPAESGWGLNIVEQGNTLFGTLFVYDVAGRPKWYSASSLVFNGSAWVGTLVESTGPYFGTAWFPEMVTRRVVGTMRIDNRGRDTLQVDYTVDGVSVSKLLNRATFRTNDLAGTYAGHVTVVPPNQVLESIPTGATTFTVSNGPNGTTIQTHALAADCTWTGTREQSVQYGQLLAIDGVYACSNGKSGRFYLGDIEVAFSGFSGNLAADGFGVANVGGTRTGPH